MSQSLPYANFRWLDIDEVSKFNVSCLTDDDSNVGYILEVDLDYPNQLFQNHNDFPFCMENIKPMYISSKEKKVDWQSTSKNKLCNSSKKFTTVYQ